MYYHWKGVIDGESNICDEKWGNIHDIIDHFLLPTHYNVLSLKRGYWWGIKFLWFVNSTLKSAANMD